MCENELSVIFGKTAIWDFYHDNKLVESLKYDAQNNFITCSGNAYSILNIRVCFETGVLSFQKKTPGGKPLNASLVFIKDKTMLVGFEGTKQVKYMKTAKKFF